MIKNYTSTVPAARSIAQIEHRLASFGASMVIKTYDAAKQISGIYFTIDVQGREMTFSLPANIANVHRILKNRMRRPPKSEADKKMREQAERCAWKLLADSVECDLSLIEINQVEFLQKFLAYAIVNGETKQTLYERLKGDRFKLLEAPK